MVRHVRAVLNEEDFNKAEAYKAANGLTWEQLILKGAETTVGSIPITLDQELYEKVNAYREWNDLTWAQILLKGAELPYKEEQT